jgi:L-aspartate oxidase
MWENAAIDRSARGLRTCLDDLKAIESRLPHGATEELNLIQSARLIAQAALMREESRGGHFRSDFPRAKGSWAAKRILW